MVAPDSKIIGDLIREHSSKFLPRYLKLKQMYEGKHDILQRSAQEGKPNNKIVLDYPGYITNIITGYFMGKPVAYTATEEGQDFLTELQSILRFNNEHKLNTELSKELSIKGETFEILYIDEDKEISFVQIPAEEMFIKYEASFKKKIDLAIRYYTINEIETGKDLVKVEIYTKNQIKFYTKLAENDFALDREVNHYFGEVPVIHYINNREKTGDWEKIIALINDLEARISDNANELEAFREAYLKVINMDMDADTLAEFKRLGAIVVGDGGDVDFLTKNINDSFTEHHISRLVELIHKLSMVPDISDDKFGGNLSGVAIKFKLYCMEQIAAIKENNFKEALMRRVKLICNMMNFSNLKTYNWRDIDVEFTRNVPANLQEIVDNAAKLKGIVSNETLLAQLPFVSNVQLELEKVGKDLDEEIAREKQRDYFMSSMTSELGGS